MRISILSLAIFGLFWVLTSCAPFEPYQMDMTEEIRNAKTPSAHNELAQHYEDTAMRFSQIHIVL